MVLALDLAETMLLEGGTLPRAFPSRKARGQLQENTT